MRPIGSAPRLVSFCTDFTRSGIVTVFPRPRRTHFQRDELVLIEPQDYQRLFALVFHLLAQPLQGLAGVVGHVGVLGVGQAVEVGPEQGQALGGDHLDRLVDALGVLAGQRLAEPLQRLPFAQAGQGGAGGLADVGVGVAAGLLQVVLARRSGWNGSHQPRLLTAAAR